MNLNFVPCKLAVDVEKDNWHEKANVHCPPIYRYRYSQVKRVKMCSGGGALSCLVPVWVACRWRRDGGIGDNIEPPPLPLCPTLSISKVLCPRPRWHNPTAATKIWLKNHLDCIPSFCWRSIEGSGNHLKLKAEQKLSAYHKIRECLARPGMNHSSKVQLDALILAVQSNFIIIDTF